MGRGEIQAVIFDFGNVLSIPVNHAGVLSLASKLSLPKEQFISAYKKNRPPFDKGTITFHEYWRMVFCDLSSAVSEEIIEDFISRDVEDWTHINPQMLSWQGILSENGYRTAILSNLPEYYGVLFRKNFPWLNTFHTVIFSCDVNVIKPELKIYDLCIEGLGIDPGRVLFLDDYEENVIGARSAGLNAEVFINSEKTIPYISRKYSLPGMQN